MQKIDLKSWSRIQQYNFFKSFDIPRYTITVDLDMTKFITKVKEKKDSFYLSFMYLVMKEVNQIENFLYRIIEEDVFLLKSSHPSFTDSIEGTDLFKFVTADLEDNLDDFIKNARQKSKDQGQKFIDYEAEERVDVVYVTSFPWAKYTMATNAYNLDKKDSIPRIAWGKYELENDKIMMPFSIEVHHALVDGLHVGRLIQNIQKALNK